MRKLPSPGTTSHQRQAWPRPTESALFPDPFFYPREDSTTLHTSSPHAGWGLSPLSVPPHPRPASVLPQPPSTLCLHPFRGFLDYSQLSDLWEGARDPLHLLSGLLLGFSTIGYLTIPFSDSALFGRIRGWKNQGFASDPGPMEFGQP